MQKLGIDPRRMPLNEQPYKTQLSYSLISDAMGLGHTSSSTDMVIFCLVTVKQKLIHQKSRITFFTHCAVLTAGKRLILLGPFQLCHYRRTLIH